MSMGSDPRPVLICRGRGIPILETPEERVRQQMLARLEDLGWRLQSDYVKVEYPLRHNQTSNDRIDILLNKPALLDDGSVGIAPYMVIELKEPLVALDDDVHDQAWRYCKQVGVCLYALWNGRDDPQIVEVTDPQKEGKSFRYLANLPTFEEVCEGAQIAVADAEDDGEEWLRKDIGFLNDPDRVREYQNQYPNFIAPEAPYWIAREALDLYGLLICNPLTTPTDLPWVGYGIRIIELDEPKYITLRDAGGDKNELYLRPFQCIDKGGKKFTAHISIYGELSCENHPRYKNRKSKTVLVVSISLGGKGRSRDLQLNLHQYASSMDGHIELFHSGAMGKQSTDELIQALVREQPSLVDHSGKVILGRFLAGGFLDWNQVKDTILRVIAYSCIRKQIKLS